MKALWKDKSSTWTCGQSLCFYGSSFDTLHKTHACLLFMESRAFGQRRWDICLVTGFMAWHGRGLCQAPKEMQPSLVLFYSELLLCFNKVFQVYYCMHVTFYRLWQGCDTLQGALMIQIDCFTTGSFRQALSLVQRGIPTSPIGPIKHHRLSVPRTIALLANDRSLCALRIWTE